MTLVFIPSNSLFTSLLRADLSAGDSKASGKEFIFANSVLFKLTPYSNKDSANTCKIMLPVPNSFLVFGISKVCFLVILLY
ncbi:hypothetical protein M2451_000823 [Dysgonomonas sp. PFB1-18]|nr:hypothetical protein [Dysgonomonas sp. PF1-14]MDH6338013.1 hypothetical protein [Dysgonomonas sp. PF1-16]MDH6379510.1 hypothetical protein [Dysgonomonas sp. PFB1-18]